MLDKKLTKTSHQNFKRHELELLDYTMKQGSVATLMSVIRPLQKPACLGALGLVLSPQLEAIIPVLLLTLKTMHLKETFTQWLCSTGP